jgi:hypothetical protein
LYKFLPNIPEESNINIFIMNCLFLVNAIYTVNYSMFMNFLKNKSILIIGEIGPYCNLVGRKTSTGNIQDGLIEEIWNGLK